MFPRDKLADLLATPFFAALSPASIDDLLPQLVLARLSGGKILFRAGDAGDSMFIVLSGRLRVIVHAKDGESETIRELSRGDTVGELALLTGEARSATICAIRDTELAMLSRSAFERAVKSDPALIQQIAVQLAARQRLGGQAEPSRRNIRTVSILPVDDGREVSVFADQLAGALARSYPTRRVSREILQTDEGFEFVESTDNLDGETRLSARLNAIEANHRPVIYQADADLTPWTKCCVRQADLILVVGRADAAVPKAALQRLQDYFDSRTITARVEMVFLHGPAFVPDVTTTQWFATMRASAHHHVVPGKPADIDRLARVLTGHAVGLVLSGGGARGFAHIGVIRALTERKIPIDYIGGTSMGAVIAAQHALGWDWQTLLRVNREEWPRCKPQKNYTLPLAALNSGRRMDEMLRRMFGSVAIENLYTQFFCVSTNLTTGGANIHQEGTLWKAVRASVSMPGIGPPAIAKGEILVDGGLVDNLPVETMRKLCQGRVYAVDVSEQIEFRSKMQESYTVSGWKLLWQQINPFGEKPDIPNILNTLYRTTTVGGIRAVDNAKTRADLCFEPPVSRFGVFQWNSVDQIIEVGYRHAQKKLDDASVSIT